MLPSILAMTILAITMSGIAIVFQIRRARLPDATRYEHIRELRAQEEVLLETRRDELSEVEQKIQDRDRLIAEVGALEERSAALNAELSILDPARQQIEEVKADAARAAEALAVVTQELNEKQTELTQVTADLDPEHLNKLRAENETLTAERTGLMQSLPELRTEREAALRAIEEARILSTRQEVLKEAIGGLDAEIAQRQDDRNALREAEESLGRARDEGARLQDETGRLAARRDSLSAEIEKLKTHEDELNKMRSALHDVGAELAQNRVAHDALVKETELSVTRNEELGAKAQQLEAHIARLKEESGVEEAGDVADEKILSDLRTAPTCLYDYNERAPIWPKVQKVESENDALARVEMLLDKSGLDFSKRTINAFHTSLKTSVISPLTVLAGISGTGKSLLPRRYADAMGMHFLKISVQPRWDGPQDLFGFYNYIEKRYKATDLARALVHMDPYNWETEAEPFKDRMLIVLLDEMNLARVEYYFSEFLSRLEGRSSDHRAADPRERAPAEIPIDVSRQGQPLRVYAGQNILFVGTMNEDESTLALSDKVMDRANIMRFPRPSELRDELPDIEATARSEGYLSKDRWISGWMRDADDLEPVMRKRATDIIEEINGVMDEMARPFGHRMSQAMLHYVANYPGQDTVSLNAARVNFGLADQIEQRIMPKLRGVDVVSDRNALHKLAEIAGNKLSDQKLGDAIEQAITRSERSIGIFNWRGFQRMDS
jgi:hypothetical protein